MLGNWGLGFGFLMARRFLELELDFFLFVSWFVCSQEIIFNVNEIRSFNRIKI
jgi:hypothetical protein